MSEVTKENFRASFDPKRVGKITRAHVLTRKLCVGATTLSFLPFNSPSDHFPPLAHIEVERDLDNLPNVPKTQIQSAVDNLVQRIQLLEKAVTDNISILPPYDTRICLEVATKKKRKKKNSMYTTMIAITAGQGSKYYFSFFFCTSFQAVKAASERLSVLRGRLVPRPKFSFKSRKTVATATSPSALQVSNAATSASVTQSTVDTSLFMTFKNRTGEYLFIGDLQVPNSVAQHDATGPSPSAMMVDTETIYLGGVQVNNNTTASVPAAVEKPKDVALTNLTDCTINLVHTSPLGAIHIKNLKRCVLVMPPVSGSMLLHDCEGCTIIGACHQVKKTLVAFLLPFRDISLCLFKASRFLTDAYFCFVCSFLAYTKTSKQSRMHTSTNMDIYLHVTSEPIIEDCTDMRFAPYPYQEVLPTDQLLTLFVAAGLRPEKNLFENVKDFNWLRQQQSPNWRLLDASEIRQGIAHHVLYTQRA